MTSAACPTFCYLDRDRSGGSAAVRQLDVKADCPCVAHGLDRGPGGGEVAEAFAQDRVEMLGHLADGGTKRGVEILRRPCTGTEPKVHGHASLDEEQRLVVIRVPYSVEHGSDDHEADPSAETAHLDPRALRRFGDPSVENVDVVGWFVLRWQVRPGSARARPLHDWSRYLRRSAPRRTRTWTRLAPSSWPEAVCASTPDGT